MSGHRFKLPPRAVLSAAGLLAFVLFSLTHGPAPRAQEQPQQRPTPEPVELGEDDVLKIDTDLILVDVMVTDAEGRAVKGLRPEDFKLYEDGDERPVAFLQKHQPNSPQAFSTCPKSSSTGVERPKIVTDTRSLFLS